MAKDIKDEWGDVIKAGDFVNFSYGIPPTGVTAEVVERDGVLWILTPNLTPKEERLSKVKKWYSIYRETPTQTGEKDE